MRAASRRGEPRKQFEKQQTYVCRFSCTLKLQGPPSCTAQLKLLDCICSAIVPRASCTSHAINTGSRTTWTGRARLVTRGPAPGSFFGDAPRNGRTSEPFYQSYILPVQHRLVWHATSVMTSSQSSPPARRPTFHARPLPSLPSASACQCVVTRRPCL